MKINVYELPVFDLLEGVLDTFHGDLPKEVREKIVLDFGRALVESHTILKEQAHDEQLQGELRERVPGAPPGSLAAVDGSILDTTSPDTAGGDAGERQDDAGRGVEEADDPL